MSRSGNDPGSVSSASTSTSTPTKRSAEDATRRGPVTASACTACKARKSKCDGGPGPCLACLQRQTECVFEPYHDKRRKEARQQKENEAALYDRLLFGLLDTIRLGQEADVQDLIGTIRSDASFQELQEVVDQKVREKGKSSSKGTTRPPEPETSAPSSLGPEHMPREQETRLRDNGPSSSQSETNNTE